MLGNRIPSSPLPPTSQKQNQIHLKLGEAFWVLAVALLSHQSNTTQRCSCRRALEGMTEGLHPREREGGREAGREWSLLLLFQNCSWRHRLFFHPWATGCHEVAQRPRGAPPSRGRGGGRGPSSVPRPRPSERALEAERLKVGRSSGPRRGAPAPRRRTWGGPAPRRFSESRASWGPEDRTSSPLPPQEPGEEGGRRPFTQPHPPRGVCAAGPRAARGLAAGRTPSSCVGAPAVLPQPGGT